MNHKILLVSLALLGLLAACTNEDLTPSFAVAGASITAPEPMEFNRVQGYVSHINLSSANCAADAFTLPGQAHFRGTTGAFTEAVSGTPFDPSNATTAQAEGKTLSFLPKGSPLQDSALLVVDHFGGKGKERYELDARIYDMDTEEAALFQESGGFFHGTLVLHHINALIQGTGLYSYSPKSTPETAVWQTSSGAELRVVAVNTDAGPSSQIAQNIQNALDKLHQASIQQTAINMSFIVLPCDLIKDFQLSKWKTFDDYVQALAADQKVPQHEVESFVRGLVETANKPADPLYTLVNDSLSPIYSASQNVYVASSGNFSKAYAMYPAAWDKVVSVSGSSVQNPASRETGMFNAGEVMTTGAVFNLNDRTGQIQSQLYYAGTSESAPAVSLFSALDLASGSPRCLVAGQDKSRLAHNDPVEFDKPLADAVVQYCP